MLHHPGYPLELWGEAVLAACYLSNRLPSRALDGKTPFEAWFGYKPDVTHLRRWGCVAYAHIPEQLRKKLDVKAHRGIFVGYDNPNGTYQIFDPSTNKIISTKDWIISENEFWDFGEGAPCPNSQPNNVETVILQTYTYTSSSTSGYTRESTVSYSRNCNTTIRMIPSIRSIRTFVTCPKSAGTGESGRLSGSG